MLTIEVNGAKTLLAYLSSAEKSGVELERVLQANPFFVDFYCQWSGVTRETLADAIAHCAQPGWTSPSQVLTVLSMGFRRAIEEHKPIAARLEELEHFDLSDLSGRVLPYLPAGTPLSATIHVTIDSFNGGFQFREGIGFSIFVDQANPALVMPMLAHELHHSGFRYWSQRDSSRQALLASQSGRAVAVGHVENLLMEGMANFFCSPFPKTKAEVTGMPPEYLERYWTRLEGFRRNERALFAQAEAVLAQCLEPGADLEACRRAYDAIAIDLEGIEPAGHYIGFRMVEIISRNQPAERLVDCVHTLAGFLPLYNRAAAQAGGYLFDPALVDGFEQLVSGRKY